MKATSLIENYSIAARITIAVAFSLFMVLAAYIRIPLFFTPVPLTLQTLVVYLGIVVLRRKAVFSQSLYMLLGISGLSVFANGGAGVLYLFGPTGGYLIGFLLASLIFPYLLPEKFTFPKVLLFFTSCACLIYFCGLSWLILMHRFSLSAALVSGFYPFLPGAAIKIAIASLFTLKMEAQR